MIGIKSNFDLGGLRTYRAMQASLPIPQRRNLAMAAESVTDSMMRTLHSSSSDSTRRSLR